jgi:hypothetical protein
VLNTEFLGFFVSDIFKGGEKINEE